jgi:SAM-dependent methyltransferase
MSISPTLTGKKGYVVKRFLLSRHLVLEGEVQKLLDVGCGEGILLSLIGDDVEKHGVDILEHIPESSGRINYLRHDVSSGLPYPDGTFDVVHSSELIEHLLDTEFFWVRVPPGSQAWREVGGFHTQSPLLAEYCGVASRQSVFLC